jgi:hypothetical protein
MEDKEILDQVISLTQLPGEEYTHGDILNLISDLLTRVSA